MFHHFYIVTPVPLSPNASCVSKALTDRASRGLSLMPGFKSRQEKAGAKVRVASRGCVSRFDGFLRKTVLPRVFFFAVASGCTIQQ